MRVVGLGAGGHGKVTLEIVQLLGEHEVVGLLDPRPELHGTEVLGVPVIGDDTLLDSLRGEGAAGAFIGVGAVTGTGARRRLFGAIVAHDMEPISAIHPTANLSPSAGVGAGVTLMAGAIVNPGAVLGDNVIVNTGAVVDHDCELGDHVHVATGATLAGTVRLGDGALVGAGATVLPGVTVGADAVVGAGAVVTSDCEPGAVVVGVPARRVR
jgi:UDP-perosamine 4-acetyltransferase